MPVRRTKRLTTVEVGKLPIGRHGDDPCLYLVVRPNSRAWTFRYRDRRDGRLRDLSLGPTHAVGLADARRLAADCRRMLVEGIDPIDQRRERQAAASATAARTLSFQAAGERYIAAHQAGWRNPKHAAQWPASLARYAYPTLGKLPVAAIDTAAVLGVLEPIWTAKPETASRVRGRIESVLDWSTARGFRSGDNPARWRGHLDHLLPARAKVRAVEHHAALPWRELPAFMVELRRQDGIAARAVEFVILTAARTGEALGSTWAEFDLDNAVWTVPPERMKAGREHRVALSGDAVALLQALPREHGNPFVFIGSRAGHPLSNMAGLMLLRRMGRADLTVHGFRSTFRDWAGETSGHAREVVEHALAHRLKDRVEAAYQRGDLIQKRRRLMEDWSRYCAGAPVTADVVPLRAAR